MDLDTPFDAVWKWEVANLKEGTLSQWLSVFVSFSTVVSVLSYTLGHP